MNRIVKNQDLIFNCAGQTSHPLSLSNPFLDVEINCLGNLTVLEAARKYNKKARLIYTSSSTLIGRARDESVDERHSELPLDIYSANKGVVEKYHYIYSKVHGLTTLSLRFANLYGPYGKGSPEFGFINYFIDLAYRNKEITIYGSGRQKRNVMYSEDAAELLYRCALRKDIFNDVYFAVHREHYSIYEIAKTIIKVFKKGRIKKIPWPEVRKKIEIDNVIISGAKLFYKIKWEPKFDLENGLLKTKQILDSNRKKN
jgi:nucleoside-diphosphate-sugar epimerase